MLKIVKGQLTGIKISPMKTMTGGVAYHQLQGHLEDPKSGGQKWTPKVAVKKGPQKWRSKVDPKSGGQKQVLVLLSALFERFDVSRMRDFLNILCQCPLFLLGDQAHDF